MEGGGGGGGEQKHRMRQKYIVSVMFQILSSSGRKKTS